MLAVSIQRRKITQAIDRATGNPVELSDAERAAILEAIPKNRDAVNLGRRGGRAGTGAKKARSSEQMRAAVMARKWRPVQPKPVAG